VGLPVLPLLLLLLLIIILILILRVNTVSVNIITPRWGRSFLLTATAAAKAVVHKVRAAHTAGSSGSMFLLLLMPV
jgi:hypothetical protein